MSSELWRKPPRYTRGSATRFIATLVIFALLAFDPCAAQQAGSRSVEKQSSAVQHSRRQTAGNIPAKQLIGSQVQPMPIPTDDLSPSDLQLCGTGMVSAS